MIIVRPAVTSLVADFDWTRIGESSAYNPNFNGRIRRLIQYTTAFTAEQVLQNYEAMLTLPGDRGEKGQRGPQGNKGNKGLKGLKGLKGVKGPGGDKGLIATQGPKGPIGTDGDQGPTGNKGT